MVIVVVVVVGAASSLVVVLLVEPIQAPRVQVLLIMGCWGPYRCQKPWIRTPWALMEAIAPALATPAASKARNDSHSWHRKHPKTLATNHVLGPHAYSKEILSTRFRIHGIVITSVTQ